MTGTGKHLSGYGISLQGGKGGEMLNVPREVENLGKRKVKLGYVFHYTTKP